MDHQDHLFLLRKGVTPGTWADFGSGTGAFTLALAELLGPAGEIHSIDKNRPALRRQKHRLQAHFPHQTVHYYVHDYTKPIPLPALDGLVIANALHFQQRKEPVVTRLRSYLKPGGRFIVVEYNTDRGNHWVPYPLSCATWTRLAHDCGLPDTHLLATLPSSFLGEFYAAMSVKEAQPAA